MATPQLVEPDTSRFPFQMVTASKLRIPPYQPAHRREDARTQAIADHFDPDAVGALVVSDRDGALWVVDGQRRLTAALAAEYREPLPCFTFYGLDLKRELTLWRLLDDRSNQKPVDRFRAMAEAGDPPIARRIAKTLERHGYMLDYHNGPTTISGVQVVETLQVWGALATVLSVIRGAWQGDPAATHNDVLMALGAFDENFRDAYLEADLIAALRPHSPAKLRQDAIAARNDARTGRSRNRTTVERTTWGTMGHAIWRLYDNAVGDSAALPFFEPPRIPYDQHVITRKPGVPKRPA